MFFHPCGNDSGAGGDLPATVVQSDQWRSLTGCGGPEVGVGHQRSELQRRSAALFLVLTAAAATQDKDEETLRHQTWNFKGIPGRIPGNVCIGPVRLWRRRSDRPQPEHAGGTSHRAHRLLRGADDGGVRGWRSVRGPREPRCVLGDGDSGETEDLEVPFLRPGSVSGRFRRRRCRVRPLLRRLHGLHQRDPVGHRDQRHRAHFRLLPRETPVGPRRLRGSSGGDGHAGPVHPGHHRRREHRGSQGRGAAGHRPDHHGHRRVHGAELRLSSEPRQGPGPPAVHRPGRVGHGGLQHGWLLVVDPRGGAHGGGRGGRRALLPAHPTAPRPRRAREAPRAGGGGGGRGRGQQPEG